MSSRIITAGTVRFATKDGPGPWVGHLPLVQASPLNATPLPPTGNMPDLTIVQGPPAIPPRHG